MHKWGLDNRDRTGTTTASMEVTIDTGLEDPEIDLGEYLRVQMQALYGAKKVVLIERAQRLGLEPDAEKASSAEVFGMVAAGLVRIKRGAIGDSGGEFEKIQNSLNGKISTLEEKLGDVKKRLHGIHLVVPGQPSKRKSVDAQDPGANSEKSEAARGKEEEGHEPGKKGKKKARKAKKRLAKQVDAWKKKVKKESGLRFAAKKPEGRERAEEYLTWRWDIYRWAEEEDVSRDGMKLLLGTLLTGDAKELWKDSRDGMGMRECFRVLDRAYLGDMFDSNVAILLRCKQRKGETFEDYRRRFLNCYSVIGGKKTWPLDNALRIFMRNFNSNVERKTILMLKAMKLSLYELWRADKDLKRALDSKKGQQQQQQQRQQRRQDSGRGNRTGGEKIGGIPARLAELPTPADWTWFDGDTRRCYHCCGWGHNSRFCPVKAKGGPRVDPMDYEGPRGPGGGASQASN